MNSELKAKKNWETPIFKIISTKKFEGGTPNTNTTEATYAS